MFWTFPLTIQCLNTQTDSTYERVFESHFEFEAFVEQTFKLPGEYNLQNTHRWQDAGNQYRKTVNRPNFEGGFYTRSIKGSHKYKLFWNAEREKVKNGIIVDGHYIPGFYYWYLNYCPIYNDVTKKKDFGQVWDSDLWFFQYIMLCLLKGKHAVVVKARQRGYSFKIMALLYWSYSWFEGSVNTIGAHKDDYVGKSWRFLEFYRKHLNENTAWKRGPQRPKAGEWLERTELKTGGYFGLDSKLSGTTFKTDPENGVGGSQTFFFYEEAGIAPTLLKTVGFVRPALEKGNRTTGLIILSGAVGELDDANDIKEVFYDPNGHNFLGVPNIWDDDKIGKMSGLFVSEAYNLEGFIDKDGNSLVQQATDFINQKKKEASGNKKKELAQLDISQKPLSPKEAFAQRKDARFPTELVAAQQSFLKDLSPNSAKLPMRVELYEDDKGKVRWKNSNKEEVPYPVDPKSEDKEGVVLLHKIPEENPSMYTYFGGVDNIEVDETTSSNSLFSIYIMEGTTEEIHVSEKSNRVKITGDNIVASVTGRLSTVKKTNERALLLMRLFNAFTLCEKNKPNFISYVKEKGYNHLLAGEADVPIFKNLDLDQTDNSIKGIQMDATGKKQKIADDYLIEYLKSDADYLYEKDSEGNDTEIVTRTYSKTEFIYDYWLLEELKNEKSNTDRRDALRLANLLKHIYQANGVKKKRIIHSNSTPKPKPRPRGIDLAGTRIKTRKPRPISI
jgi:hypothetical protein